MAVHCSHVYAPKMFTSPYKSHVTPSCLTDYKSYSAISTNDINFVLVRRILATFLTRISFVGTYDLLLNFDKAKRK